jgi:hypothetical protein
VIVEPDHGSATHQHRSGLDLGSLACERQGSPPHLPAAQCKARRSDASQVVKPRRPSTTRISTSANSLQSASSSPNPDPVFVHHFGCPALSRPHTKAIMEAASANVDARRPSPQWGPSRGGRLPRQRTKAPKSSRTIPQARPMRTRIKPAPNDSVPLSRESQSVWRTRLAKRLHMELPPFEARLDHPR